MSPTLEQLCPGVEPIPGEPNTFRVQSLSDPEVSYIFDCSAWHGAGACTCPSFQTGRGKQGALRHGKLPSVATQCKHFAIVYRYIAIRHARQVMLDLQTAANSMRRANGLAPVKYDPETPIW